MLRLTTYICVFVLLGAVVLQGIVARLACGDWGRDALRELTRWGAVAGLLLVGFDVVRLWHQTYLFWGGFEPITVQLMGTIANDTIWGAGWKAQVALAAAAGTVIWTARRIPKYAWPAALPIVVLAAISRVWTGHAVEQGSWLSLPAILQAVHVVGAGVWIGTLLLMTAVGLRRVRRLPVQERPSVVVGLVERFSPIALGAATALFLAGCATSFIYLGSVSAIYSTTYGWAFAAKMGGFALVVAMGYFNWQKVRPQLDLARQVPEQDHRAAQLLMRSATLELVAANIVLLATAVLVALPMPMG